MWKDASSLKETDRIDIAKVATMKKEVYITTDVWDRNKVFVFENLMLKAIGYIPAKDRDIGLYSDIMSYDIFYEYDKYGYTRFYETCSKNGCKVTDFFLVVDGPDKFIGEVLLPVHAGLVSVNKKCLLYV